MTTLVQLDWPAKPKRSADPNFGRRLTWKCQSDAYCISSIPDYLPGEYLLAYPKWAERMPARFRTLNAAQRAAQLHRNEQ